MDRHLTEQELKKYSRGLLRATTFTEHSMANLIHSLAESNLLRYGRVGGRQIIDKAREVWRENYHDTMRLADEHGSMYFVLRDHMSVEKNLIHLYKHGSHISYHVTASDDDVWKEAVQILMRYRID